MKRILPLIVTLLILFIYSDAFAKAGPPIPVPGISISEAIDIAEEYFYNKETRMVDSDYFKVEDYILISAQYTNYIDEEYQKDWSWIIKFIHPVQNDHSVVYKVTNDKEIILLYVSE